MATVETMDCVHEGSTLRGVVARPEGNGPFPAVLVMHSAVGLNDFYKGKAPLLAEQGYLAVATDMYGAGVDISSEAAYAPLYMYMLENPQMLRERVVAWFDAIRARPDVDPDRVAAIGFCFGGKCVLELARSGADVKAVISYHGILPTHAPAQKGAVKAHVAAYCGRNDPYAPIEDIEALRHEMEAAEVTYSLMIYGDVEHGFTDPHAASHSQPGISYDAIAQKTSWAATLALLDEVLRP